MYPAYDRKFVFVHVTRGCWWKVRRNCERPHQQHTIANSAFTCDTTVTWCDVPASACHIGDCLQPCTVAPQFLATSLHIARKFRLVLDNIQTFPAPCNMRDPLQVSQSRILLRKHRVGTYVAPVSMRNQLVFYVPFWGYMLHFIVVVYSRYVTTLIHNDICWKLHGLYP